MKYSIIRLATFSVISAITFTSNVLAAQDPTISQFRGELHKPVAKEMASDINVDLAWYSKHMGEGRNQFESGGIGWATGTYQLENLAIYVSLGRGDTEHYI